MLLYLQYENYGYLYGGSDNNEKRLIKYFKNLPKVNKSAVADCEGVFWWACVVLWGFGLVVGLGRGWGITESKALRPRVCIGCSMLLILFVTLNTCN